MAEKITWADKQQGQASPKPANQKFTFGEVNELRDKFNANADLLPFTVNTDISGVMQDVKLANKNICFIIGTGPSIYMENVNFTKVLADDIIQLDDVDDIPQSFLPLSKYLIIPR